MLRFDDLALFVRTAELGSLSAAARERDCSPALASAALKRLEAELQVRLLLRSTRSLRLTAEGEQYLAHARAALVSLLVGEAPYARVFVPADIRAQVRVGDSLRVFVEGIEQPFQARVRNIRSEASFTPYYALTGDDASRLMYRAELLLEGEAARRLPAGLPLHAERLSGEPQR